MSTDHRPAVRRDPARRMLHALAAAVMVLTLAATLAACGLRAETPPPVEPSPDAVEQVRARTVTDSLALASAATQAALLPDGAAEPVAPVIADVTAFSAQHAEQLGGVYVSGLPTPTGSPTTSAPTASAAPTLAEVLEQLASATRTALADADAVPDGPLARLIASVATSRGELTARLARATGAEVPSLDPAEAPAAVDPTPTPTPSASAGSAGIDGLTTDQLGTLALVHDHAGFGFEVIAAKLAGDQRTAAFSTAASHRERSEDWAAAAGIDGSTRDPRRSSYALPAGLDDPAVATTLARTLETAVADAYANAVAQADPASRSTMIAGLRRATDDAARWGATPVPFPGLPERTEQPKG